MTAGGQRATRTPETEAPAPPDQSRIEAIALVVHRQARALRGAARRWEARAPRVVALLRVVFYPFALALVGYMGYRAARETDFSSVHYVPLVAAFVAALVWWASLAVGWASLVDTDSRRETMASWCRTQVARYLPGSFWHVLARAATVQGRIRDKLTAVTAEYVLVLVAAVAIGGIWAGFHDWRWLGLVLVVSAPVVASRWLERRTALSRRRIWRAVGIYSVGYLAYGAMGLLVQVAVSGVPDLMNALYIAGAACIAWAVGLVVVFAPGGVGVREVVYVWMLSGLYSTVELQAAAVTTRLITVLAELCVLALFSRPSLPFGRSAARQRTGSDPA